ncbi:inositol monophosphatase family protein [Streptomyces jumonjinensis]|uniref:inositol monophosphatase family protein n=1 Tax=Streptomyces jumonjinensis TaxID=1945 RepID=UPI0037B15A9D
MLITNTESDARLAVTAAQAGAAVVRDMYGTTLARYEKSAGDFATAADLAAEKAVLGVLRAARPDDAVTGEESGHTGADGAERRWLVDPLCGTLNYAVHTMLVAVNVALRVGPRITAAAVADPLICEAAGSVVTGIDGQPPHTGAGGLIVAADQRTHATLLDMVEHRVRVGR